VEGGILTLGWRALRLLPPLVAWRILHSAPPWLLDAIAKASGRPPPAGPRVELFGRRLESPVGVAAGFDKDGRLAWIAWAMGAGFHVIGSVLPHPHEGVKPKILVRLPDGGTINRLGLPSPGPRPVVRRLKEGRPPIPIAVSIAAFTAEGYGEVYRSIADVADWVEVNISCPNVVEHRYFEDPSVAAAICDHLKPRIPPLLLKIPPTRDAKRLEEYLDLARACGFAGIVATNTRRIRYRGFEAGLGGPALFEDTLWAIKTLREWAPKGFVLIGVGGVTNGAKAAALLKAGANAVEVLSSIIHRGPLAPWLIALEALKELKRGEGSA